MRIARSWFSALPWRFRTVDPSTAMFRRIGWQLAAWYTVILAATLLVIGVVLYAGERSSLLGPIDSQLHQSANTMTVAWQAFPPAPCPLEGLGVPEGELWACYDANGHLLRADRLTAALPAFMQPSLIRAALANGTASDTLNSHTAFSSVRRYAVRVSDPQSGVALGVFEVGAPVGDRISALDKLLQLLAICGVLSLPVVAAGGLFLARRSMRPVRGAYLRQRDFIADASHELRTPLTLLRADAEVLLRDRANLNADQVAILEDVVQEVSHMGALTNTMLDLAQLDAGRQHLEEGVVDLLALGREVVHRAAPLAAERDVHLRMQGDEPVLVVGDAVLLEHLALILVDNAIKYNQTGGTAEISVQRRDGRAELVVQDSGIGIAPEHLPHLGERFFRVDKARSREAGGAGLGVSIAQSIAARHRGRLELSSRLGEGTVAVLSLPAAGGREP